MSRKSEEKKQDREKERKGKGGDVGGQGRSRRNTISINKTSWGIARERRKGI